MSLFVKLSRNKKGLNDDTAAPFSVGFFAAGSWEKDTKNGATMTSLRPFLFRDNFGTSHLSIDRALRWLIVK